MKRVLLFALCAVGLAGHVHAQTNPTAQPVPYTQTFGTTSFSSPPTGMAVWTPAAASSQAAAESSTPSGNQTISTNTPASGGAGGAYGHAPSSNGRLTILQSGSSTSQLALAINTTGATSVTVAYDLVLTVANARDIGVVLQYRVGTTGAFTTIAGSAVTYNSGTSNGGDADGPSDFDPYSFSLPAAALNESVVQLRWATWRGAQTGSSSGIGFDNISVTGSSAPQPACIAPSAGPTSLTFSTPTSSSIPGTFTPPTPAADSFIVFASNTTSAAPTLINGTSYNATNKPTGYAFVSKGTGTSFTATGLQQSTTYNFFVFAYNGLNCTGGAQYNTTPATGSAATTAATPACVAPASLPTALTFPATTTTTIDGSFTATTADGYLVFRAPASTTSAPTLANGTTYTSSNPPTGYGFVSNGTNNTFSATGLQPATAYNFFVFAYNSVACTGGPAYNSTPLTGTASTQALPLCAAPGAASGISVTPASASASGTFTAPTPAPDSFVVFYSPTNSTAPTLQSGVTYGGTGGAIAPNGYTFVSRQLGTNTSFTITGLSASSQYNVFVFAYTNNTGCSGGPAYAAAASSTFTTNAIATTTYTWNAASGDWSNANNWTPARTAPASTDILLFDGNTEAAPTVTLDFPSPQGIAQLKFQNGVKAVFQIASDRTLTVGSGVAGADFDLPLGNTLSIQSTTSGAGLSLAILANNTAVVADSLILATSAVTNQDHRLTAADVAGMTFTSTGSLTLGNNFSGNVFANTVTATMLFQNESSFIQYNGSNPFNAATFQPFSNFYYRVGGSNPPSVNGRTYGNFFVQNFTTVAGTGGSPFTFNSISVESGSSLALTGTGTNAITINGNLTANGPLTINAGSGGLIFTSPNPVFSGSSRINILDSVGLATLTVNSSDSLVFNDGLTVTDALTMTAGNLITGSDTLILGISSLLPGTLNYAGGAIIGYFTRWFGATSNTGNSGLFPMARRGGGRRFATIEFTAAPGAGGTLTAALDSASLGTINATVTTDGAPCISGFTVEKLSGNYLTLTAGNGLTGGTYAMTLQYQNPGVVSNVCELAIAKRADENAPWAISGVQDFGGGTPAEPIVRHTGLSGFSDFILAGSVANPLPLHLTRFNAVAQGSIAKLSWSIANPELVENVVVERSTNGKDFAAIGSVVGANAEPEFEDRQPVRGDNFYRLRMVEIGGASLFSPVRSLQFGNAISSTISASPNPAADAVRVVGKGTIIVSLFDATGRLVRSATSGTGELLLPLHAVAAGVYILEASDGISVLRERLQVVR